MSAVVNWLRTIGALYGVTPYLDLTADDTVTQIKAGQGKLYLLTISNPNVTDVWVQLFDATKVAVDIAGLGTQVPTLSFCIPAGDGVNHTVWSPIEMPVSPVRFQTAITYAVTTTVNGAVAPAAPVVLNALYI